MDFTEHHKVSNRVAGQALSLPQLRLKVSSLRDGEHQFDLVATAAEYAPDEALTPDRFPNPIAVTVTLLKTSSDIIAALHFETVAALECDRCLKPIEKKLTGEFRVLLTASAVSSDDETEVRAFGKNDTEVDLTDDLRQTVLLSVPMKTTCETPCEIPAIEAKPALPEADEKSGWLNALKNIKLKN